jgi:RNA polymerase sigma-70 factor (ECF subfamily)
MSTPWQASRADLRRNPKAYLYRAAFNSAVDLLRARKRDTFANDLERIVGSIAREPMYPEAAERELYEAIAKLHPSSAQILILRYIHNTSIKEIAGLLGTTRSTVAVSLFRSRARLRKLIRALGDHHE